MKRLIIVVLVMMMIGSLFGVKIVLIDGRIFNGFVKAKTDISLRLLDTDINEIAYINITEIDKIYADDGSDITDNALAMSKFDYDQVDNFNYGNLNKPATITKYNPAMLAISLSLIAIAVDNFTEAKDLSKQIEDYEKLNLKTSDLKEARTRKNTVGGICILSSLFSIVKTYERVEVQASPTSLSMSYKF